MRESALIVVFVARCSRVTPSRLAVRISSALPSSMFVGRKLWTMWSVSSTTSTGHGSRAGLAGGVKMRIRAPWPCQSGPFVPRPCNGATTSSRLPSPSTSAHRIRWSVGSSAMECSVHSAPGAPCLTQCSVPPLVVLVGCQLAPSATSSRPSRSISCSARQTLSRGVAPVRMTRFCQLGASNQTRSVALIATTSVRPSPLTSPVVTA